MRDLLGKRAHVRRRLESIVGFGHLFGGPNEGISYAPVVPFDVGADRVVLRSERLSDAHQASERASDSNYHRECSIHVVNLVSHPTTSYF
jgi:hypothetical protein